MSPRCLQRRSRLPPRHKTITAARNKIRAARKASEEFSTLCQEFLDLQKTTRALRKDLDTLQKRLAATAAKPVSAKPVASVLSNESPARDDRK